MLTPEERDVVSRPWLYRYSAIDVWLSSQSEGSRVRQIETAGPIGRQLRDALLRIPKARVLACSTTDGFFGLFALFKGAGHVDIYDVGRHIPGHEAWHFDQSEVVAKIKGLMDRCSFSSADILDIQGEYDFAVCTNVLEHVPDPKPVLEKLRGMMRGSLVLHSPTAYPHGPEVFESAPAERPWGCRFSHDRLVNMAVEAGWTVINERLKHMPPEWEGERNLSFLHCV